MLNTNLYPCQVLQADTSAFIILTDSAQAGRTQSDSMPTKMRGLASPMKVKASPAAFTVLVILTGTIPGILALGLRTTAMVLTTLLVLIPMSQDCTLTGLLGRRQL